MQCTPYTCAHSSHWYTLYTHVYNLTRVRTDYTHMCTHHTVYTHLHTCANIPHVCPHCTHANIPHACPHCTHACAHTHTHTPSFSERGFPCPQALPPPACPPGFDGCMNFIPLSAPEGSRLPPGTHCDTHLVLHQMGLGATGQCTVEPQAVGQALAPGLERGSEGCSSVSSWLPRSPAAEGIEPQASPANTPAGGSHGLLP